MQTQPRRGICNSEFGPASPKAGRRVTGALAAIIRALRAVPIWHAKLAARARLAAVTGSVRGPV